MSGFEVAGLVLGAIPLVITAFEVYYDTVSKVDKWRKYGREVGKISRSLRLEQARLQSICEKLLSGLVPMTDIDVMMKDPHGPLWKAKGLQDKMSIRLWNSGKDIMAAIEDINSAIQEIMKKLKLVGGEVQWDENEIKEQFKRAKFTLKSDQYDEQMDRIKSGVTSIEKHLAANIELEPPRLRRAELKSHEILRDVTSSLFRAFRSAFVCQCPRSHPLISTDTIPSQTVEFLLRRASDILLHGPQDDQNLVPKSVEFPINVTYQVQLQDHKSHTLRDGLIVHHVIKPNRPSAAVPKSSNMSRAARLKRSVGFSNSTLSSLSIKSQPIGTSSAVSTLVQEAARTPKILSVPVPTALQDPSRLANLCRTIRASSASPRSESAYGYICDESSTKVRKYELFPTDIVKEDVDIISLGTILSECRAQQRTLSLETRLYLAVVLASSFLQLSGTGWMPEVVTHHDIFFAKRNGSVSYREPTITKPFTEPRKPGEEQHDSPLPHNTPLFSLGILLIEVILRTPFHELMGTEGDQQDPDHGIAKHLMELEVAERLLDRVRSNGDEAYKHAVRCCIENEYKNQGLEDKDVQEHLYTRVIQRLEQSLEALEHF